MFFKSDFLRKKRPPLEDVFRFRVFFEKKVSPRGCFWKTSVLKGDFEKKASLKWPLLFGKKNASPRVCFWIKIFQGKKRSPLEGVFEIRFFKKKKRSPLELVF